MKVDTKKIFLAPPKSMFERVSLFLMLLVSFVFFFSPLNFSQISPIEAILLSMLPSVSLSWGWIVLLRFLFRKSEYIVK